MNWIEAAVEIRGGDVDAVCAALETLGVSGMVIEDEADFQAFLENNKKYWDYVDDELAQRYAGVSRVKFWAEDDEAGAALVQRVRESLGLTVTTAVIQDGDWENSWRQYYQPIPVGERLLIVPAWQEAEAEGRIQLRLDPGLIFGTGSHATTRMCLCALEEISGPGKRVLDLGCGSGILGIGALLLGCDSVVGCDIDTKAPDVAGENAALSGIGPERFTIYAGDILTDAGMRRYIGTGYQIVLANIVADVIIPLAGMVRQFMAPGAVFVCSGIIEGRQDEVAAALAAAGLTVIGHSCEEEWHCFIAT